MYAPRLVLVMLLLVSQKQSTANKHSSQEQIQKPAANQTVSETRQGSPQATGNQSGPLKSQIPADDHKEQDRAQGIKEINDTLLVIFTGLLFGVGVLQWLVLRKHEEWMQKHDANLKKLADSAKDNAEAALLNAQAVIRSERPWIAGLVGDQSYRIGSNPAQVPRFWLEMKNVGRTPAKMTRVLMTFEKRQSLGDLPAEPYIDITSILPVPRIFLTSTSPSFYAGKSIFGDKALSQDEIQAVIQGKTFLIAYGIIEYEDTFWGSEHTS